MNVNGWLVDTITVASATGISDHGDLSYAANRSVKARVEDFQRLVKDQRGNEIMAEHRIATQTQIKYDDNLWMPDENPAVDQPHNPIKIHQASTKPGSQTLYEVFL